MNPTPKAAPRKREPPWWCVPCAAGLHGPRFCTLPRCDCCSGGAGEQPD